jgi:hypothetical protein
MMRKHYETFHIIDYELHICVSTVFAGIDEYAACLVARENIDLSTKLEDGTLIPKIAIAPFRKDGSKYLILINRNDIDRIDITIPICQSFLLN